MLGVGVIIRSRLSMCIDISRPHYRTSCPTCRYLPEDYGVGPRILRHQPTVRLYVDRRILVCTRHIVRTSRLHMVYIFEYAEIHVTKGALV